MIDMHLHLLPSIDDGAETLEDSVAMLDMFTSLGYTRLITTPHLEQPLTENRTIEIESALTQVRARAQPFGLTVDLGFEHILTPAAISRLTDGERTTLADSRAVLVELPAFIWSGYTEAMLFELQVAGLAPVLAHPERYPAVQDRPGLALDVADRGVVLQVTTAALAGALGPSVRDTARVLLQESLEREALVVLASDAHSAGRRLSQVTTGFDWIRRHFENAEAIIAWTTATVPASILASASGEQTSLERLRHEAPSASRSRRGRWRFW